MINKNKIKELKHNEYLHMFVVISAFLCLVAIYFLKTRKPIIFGNDQLFQYDVFYREWFRLIRDFFEGKGLPMYSWNMYLGTDFYSSMTYYCIGDIFVLILFPLNLIISSVKQLLTIEIILCIYLSCFMFAILLKKKGIKNKSIIIIASLIYALGGWFINFLGNYMFHRFYTFLPLLFIGIEDYYQNKKVSVVIIAVALLFMQNFYMMYPTSIFLFMYCLTKEYSFPKEIRKERLIKDTINLIKAYIIGVLIASIILFPAILSVLSNSRVGETGGGGLFWELKIYVQFILSPISSLFPVFSNYPDIFYLYYGGHGFWYVIFIGIVFFISAINYLLHKENKAHLYLALILLAVAIFKPLSSIMHGFSVASFRWLFLVEFYFLLIGSEELDKNEKINNMIFNIYIFMCIIGVIILLLDGNQFIDFKVHYIAIGFYIIASIILWIIFIKNRRIALIFSLLEILFLSLLNIHFYNHYGRYDNLIDRDKVEYYESIDDDLIYRYFIGTEDIVPDGILNLNMPMDYGFMSSKTYNSMYDNVTNKFNLLNGQEYHFIDITNPYSLNMLGTKYWIVSDETKLPQEFNFRYAYNFDDLKVYENLNYKGFAYTLDKVKHFSEYKELKDFDKALFVEDDKEITNSKKEYKKLNIIEKKNNYLKANIELNDDNILFLAIPNNPGWKVLVNNEVVKTFNINGGFIGIDLNKGYNEIELSFMTPGLKSGLFATTIGIILFIIIFRKERNNINL